MTQTSNTIPTRPDDSPCALELLAEIDAMTIGLPAPTVKGLSFQINSHGQHIATLWDVEPDARTKSEIEEREAGAYFNDDMTLSPARLQSALSKAYERSDIADAAEDAAYAAFKLEAENVANLDALRKKHKLPELIATGEAANCVVWDIRYALLVCPAKTPRDLYVKVIALRDDALSDMEPSDARALLSLVRDMEALNIEAQS